MDECAILERIIEEGGSCMWATDAICQRCPLGHTSRDNEMRTPMSCIEAVNIDGLSMEETDAKYKAAAINRLADLAIQQVIEAD